MKLKRLDDTELELTITGSGGIVLPGRENDVTFENMAKLHKALQEVQAVMIVEALHTVEVERE